MVWENEKLGVNRLRAYRKRGGGNPFESCSPGLSRSESRFQAEIGISRARAHTRERLSPGKREVDVRALGPLLYAFLI